MKPSSNLATLIERYFNLLAIAFVVLLVGGFLLVRALL